MRKIYLESERAIREAIRDHVQITVRDRENGHCATLSEDDTKAILRENNVYLEWFEYFVETK